MALRLKPIIRAKAKEQQGKRTDISQTFGKSSIHTNKELGKIAGISDETIRKVEIIEKEGIEPNIWNN